MYDQEQETRGDSLKSQTTSIGGDILQRFNLLRDDDKDRVLESLFRTRAANQRPAEVRDTPSGAAKMAPPRLGITLDNVDRVFTYHPWNHRQEAQGDLVKEAIVALARAILRNVPDGPDRSVALRKLRELRMDVNAAITHGGEF